jgi:hypothetical protein
MLPKDPAEVRAQLKQCREAWLGAVPAPPRMPPSTMWRVSSGKFLWAMELSVTPVCPRPVHPARSRVILVFPKSSDFILHGLGREAHHETCNSSARRLPDQHCGGRHRHGAAATPVTTGISTTGSATSAAAARPLQSGSATGRENSRTDHATGQRFYYKGRWVEHDEWDRHAPERERWAQQHQQPPRQTRSHATSSVPDRRESRLRPRCGDCRLAGRGRTRPDSRSGF